MLKIQNITATAKIADKLDLLQLARHLWNVEYNPKRFSALIMRIRNPRVTGLVFQTGKIVVIGAKSEEEANKGAEKMTKLIRRTTKVQLEEFRIENMVASSSVTYRISLENLHATKPGFVYYEPEFFSPACQMRYKKEEKFLALIFRTGKIIFTGTTNFKDIQDFHSYLLRLLLKYKE